MDVVSRNLLGHAFHAYETAQYEQAAEHFEELTKVMPEHWGCRVLLGRSLYKCNRLAQARHQFTHVVENCPNHVLREQALNDLKFVIYQEDSPETARVSIPMNPIWEHQATA